jgi:flagellar motor protein MotB
MVRLKDTNRNYTAEGVEEGSVVVLKAKALEAFDTKLARFEEMLEKLIQEMERAIEEIRKEIRRTKLMIIIGFTALIAFQILLRWIRFRL